MLDKLTAMYYDNTACAEGKMCIRDSVCRVHQIFTDDDVERPVPPRLYPLGDIGRDKGQYIRCV